jgi:predicted HAD superfamily Cof-like phosphohydrolase
MDENLESVLEFHRKFGVPVRYPHAIPAMDRCDLRVRLLQEELDELREGIENQDIVEIFDALCDLQYVLDGTFLEFGLMYDKQLGMDEVHRSNMSKLDDQGNPIYRESDGKVLKGPNYSPPDLKSIIERDIIDNG